MKDNKRRPELTTVTQHRMDMFMYYLGMKSYQIFHGEFSEDSQERHMLFQYAADCMIEEEADEAAASYMFEKNDGQPVVFAMDQASHQTGDDTFDNMRAKMLREMHEWVYWMMDFREEEKEKADTFGDDFERKWCDAHHSESNGNARN